MKINNFRPMNVNPYTKQFNHQAEKPAAAKQKDKVEISAEALKLQQTSQIETERLQKVNELKKKIESGEYKINPEEIARKMYSFWNND